MTSDHLNKLIRIADTVRNLAAEARKENRSHLHSYKEHYKSQYQLINPIFISDLDYQLEFLALKKPDGISYTEIQPALTSMSTFIDGVIRQETLSRQQEQVIAREYFIESDKPFSAYQQITSIINKSVDSLKIVDNYVDGNTLDFFLGVNVKSIIQVLTLQCLPNVPAFKKAIKKFKSQWGGNFEVKQTQYFHDRFIIIDNVEVWHLGPSLNRLGKKPMMISQIRDKEIQNKVLDIFDQQWKTSSFI